MTQPPSESPNNNPSQQLKPLTLSPPVNSAITSVLLVLATHLGTWARDKGYISAGEEGILESAGVVLILAAIASYKVWQVMPRAIIYAINAQNNGVKVVRATEPVPMVMAPLKGPGSTTK